MAKSKLTGTTGNLGRIPGAAIGIECDICEGSLPDILRLLRHDNHEDFTEDLPAMGILQYPRRYLPIRFNYLPDIQPSGQITQRLDLSSWRPGCARPCGRRPVWA